MEKRKRKVFVRANGMMMSHRVLLKLWVALRGNQEEAYFVSTEETEDFGDDDEKELLRSTVFYSVDLRDGGFGPARFAFRIEESEGNPEEYDFSVILEDTTYTSFTLVAWPPTIPMPELKIGM